MKWDGDYSKSGSAPAFSLGRLLKDLKIKSSDLGGRDTSPELGELLKGRELKGILCAECELLLEKTMQLLEQMELLQLKLGYYLSLIALNS